MYFGLVAEPLLTFVSLNSSNRKRRVAFVWPWPLSHCTAPLRYNSKARFKGRQLPANDGRRYSSEQSDRVQTVVIVRSLRWLLHDAACWQRGRSFALDHSKSMEWTCYCARRCQDWFCSFRRRTKCEPSCRRPVLADASNGSPQPGHQHVSGSKIGSNYLARSE